ncbi:MAG: hypothetical protein IJW59_02215 [Clostridia bacterium]|nr:hypothetical protein [Clostridia bacterium]
MDEDQNITQQESQVAEQKEENVIISESVQTGESEDVNSVANDIVYEGDSRNETAVMPAKYFFGMNMERLGIICSNLTIVLMSLILFGFLGMILYPFLIVFNLIIAIGLVILTLGTILLSYKFESLLLFKGDALNKYGDIFWGSFNIIAGVAVALAVISVIMFCLSKNKGFTSRIILNIIFGIIALFVFVIGFFKV